jgi:aminopeptidase-like protein
VIEWSPYGYDERQFCSPGFDLPVGRLSRAPHGTYPEYHTSADNLDFVDAARVSEAVDFMIAHIDRFEARDYPKNLLPKGEPQLGRRGLYTSLGGSVGDSSAEMPYLWVLSLADGDYDISDIAHRAQLPEHVVRAAAERLRDAGIVDF